MPSAPQKTDGDQAMDEREAKDHAQKTSGDVPMSDGSVAVEGTNGGGSGSGDGKAEDAEDGDRDYDVADDEEDRWMR